MGQSDSIMGRNDFWLGRSDWGRNGQWGEMTGYQPQTYPVKQKVTTCINFEVRGDTKLLYAD